MSLLDLRDMPNYEDSLTFINLDNVFAIKCIFSYLDIPTDGNACRHYYHLGLYKSTKNNLSQKELGTLSFSIEFYCNKSDSECLYFESKEKFDEAFSYIEDKLCELDYLNV